MHFPPRKSNFKLKLACFKCEKTGTFFTEMFRFQIRLLQRIAISKNKINNFVMYTSITLLFFNDNCGVQNILIARFKKVFA